MAEIQGLRSVVLYSKALPEIPWDGVWVWVWVASLSVHMHLDVRESTPLLLALLASGFTTMASMVPASNLVRYLDILFGKFDQVSTALLRVRASPNLSSIQMKYFLTEAWGGMSHLGGGGGRVIAKPN